MMDSPSVSITRRRLLASTAILGVGGFRSLALGRTYRGGALPWEWNDTTPPIPVRPGPWLYFTADEAAAVEAIVDRLIPSDESGPGGKEAGCAVFIDRQLAGSFGDSRRLYMRPPFANGTPSQGVQSSIVPKERTVFQDRPHFEFGIVSGDGVHLLWQEAIGSIRGRCFIMTRQELDALTAQEWGAVNEIVPTDKLLVRAREIGEGLAKLPPLATRYTRIAMTQKLPRIIDEGVTLGLALEGISAAGIARGSQR